MKRFVAVVAVVGMAAVAQAATSWATVEKRVRESIVEIANTGGACTGFVIDNKRDFVATAAHCDGPELYADLAPAKIQAKDVKNDLLVLKVEGIDHPALKLAKVLPTVSEAVASYGWGYALETPLFRLATLSARDVHLERAIYDVIDAAFVPGQSGGPVVNAAGEVVMMVQLGNEITGFGVNALVLREKIGKYFEE